MVGEGWGEGEVDGEGGEGEGTGEEGEVGEVPKQGEEEARQCPPGVLEEQEDVALILFALSPLFLLLLGLLLFLPSLWLMLSLLHVLPGLHLASSS